MVLKVTLTLTLPLTECKLEFLTLTLPCTTNITTYNLLSIGLQTHPYRYKLNNKK